MVETADPYGSEPAAPGDGPALASGSNVDHFTITRLLSRGGMGEVYLARDAKLGRRVALKLIRATHLSSPASLSRFLLEARATAKFNHPNIVTIHGAGEFQGRPYVALEYLEGQNLRERMLERRPSQHEAIRMMLGVAEALAEAHRVGVLHLDLKPENVVIPRDGRVRVVDFGLARSVRAVAASHHPGDEPSDHGIDDEPTGDLVLTEEPDDQFKGWGTAAYMAPEQWRQGRASSATDVWALGVLLYELVAGRLPYDDEDSNLLRERVLSDEAAPRLSRVTDAPPRLTDLVAACLNKDPGARPDANEIAQELRELLPGGRAHLDEEHSPFRGLLPFTERHADVFFGREGEVASFVERLRHEPVLPVVGASGAGKSSLVRAGVIPRLREQEPWIVLSMRPGNRPFLALAGRLLRRDGAQEDLTLDQLRSHPKSEPPPSSQTRATGELEELARDLEQSPRHLALELRELAAGQGARVLLFVDQLEELFTLVEDASEQKRFMEALCTAADDPLDPVRIVFTVREDFLGRLVTGPEVREVLSSILLVQPLAGDALREVLTKPLRAAGYRYEEPEIVDEMVSSVRGEPSALPLLQFTAQRLWDERHPGRKLLLRSAYERIGGVEGALASHADGVIDALSAAEQILAKKLLLRMVTPERTRKVLSRQRIVDGLGDDAEGVLKRLTTARLVTIRRARVAETGTGTTLELAHESLISSWRRLARWLDESEDELALISEIGQAAKLWDARKRRPEELWQGQALAEAERAIARGGIELSALGSEFIEAARRRQRWRGRRRRGAIAVALGALSAIAIVLAWQKQRADDQRDVAEDRRAEALREGARAAFGHGRLLEARAKLRVALEARDAPAARALWWQLSTDPLVWAYELGAIGYEVAIAPDGRQLAVANLDGSLYLFDMATRELTVLRGHTDQVDQVRYTPDGKLLVSGGHDETVRIWNRASGEVVHTLRGHHGLIEGLAVSADGQRIASASDDKSVKVWSIAGELLASLQDDVVQSNVVFLPDDKRLVAATKTGAMFVWDIASKRKVATLKGHESLVWGLAVDARGRLASGSEDDSIRIWDVDRGEALKVLEGHPGGVHTLEFSPDGRMLVSAGGDELVRIWDSQTWSVLRTLPGHEGNTMSAVFGPDNTTLATAGHDQWVRVYNLDIPTPDRPVSGHEKGTIGVCFSPDGKTVASAGYDTTVRLWDTASGEPRAVLRGHTGTSYGVDFSPDGKTLASAGTDGTVRLWDVASGRERAVLRGHRGDAHDVAFSPVAPLLASSGADGAIRFWDPGTGEERGMLLSHEADASQIGFSADGTRLVSGGADSRVHLWDLALGVKQAKSLRVFDQPEAAVDGAAISADGRTLASGGYDDTLRIYDADSGEARVLGKAEGRIYWMAFHPDGKRLVSAGSEGAVRIWSLTDGSSRQLRGHRGEVNVVALSPDGKLIASTADDTTVRLWELDSGRPRWRAPLMLGSPPRLFSHRGWRRLDRSGDATPTARAWPDAVANHALFAIASDSQTHLCLLTHERTVELWDMASDRRAADLEGAATTQLVATSRGCAALDDAGTLTLLDRDGSKHSVELSHVTAIGVADGLLVAHDDELTLLDASGKLQAQTRAGRGAVALTRDGDQLITGYPDGNLELVSLASGDRSRFRFEDVPSAPPRSLLAGPAETVIAGFADGSMGVWSRRNGAKLAGARLHGGVTHLRLESHELYAASDLGQHLVWDLEALYLDYCELMRAVWQRVPVIWEGGHPQLAAPAPDHRCAR